MSPRLAGILTPVLLATACAANLAPRAPADRQPEPLPEVAPPAVKSPFALDGAASITESSVRGHMTFLASDALNGRGSGTRDEWIAAAYLGAQMLQAGLEPLGDNGGFVQKVEIERIEAGALPVLDERAMVTPEVKAGSKRATWNAVGRLAGRDPAAASEVILLSAHLDHVGSRPAPDGGAAVDTIYNGADDDASGSVAVLELAKALALGPRPRRTIVFAFFGSEEAGGHGARFFAEKPVVPLTQLVANIQFEMIGRPDAAVPPHTLWFTGYERSTLGPALAEHGARLVRDPRPEQNFFMRSDNIQFARRGVVAHAVSSFGLHKEYHQPSDELQHIDFAHMTAAIRSFLEPVRWLANSTFRPEWLPGMKP